MSKKVFVFLPDGVGLRNFALTRFKEVGETYNFEIVYWNNTVFSLKEELGYDEVSIESTAIHPMTPVYSRARKRIELNIFDKKFNETVYNTYNFPHSYKGIKNALKSLTVDALVCFGLNNFVRKQIKKNERTTEKYALCKKQLLEHKPDLVFCTNQRPTQAISALLAAQDLGIPTATFIFSWDNLPKAMTVVETDYYFVWSEHMKMELLKYHSYVNESQIIVSGTPQFESHFDSSLLQSKEVFFATHKLDLKKKYICYSGDDIVTSPLDQF